MLQSEFERLTDRPCTAGQFEVIHKVYCYHPAISQDGLEGKRQIATLWSLGGMRLIADMLPTTEKSMELEQRARVARMAYEKARDEYADFLGKE